MRKYLVDPHVHTDETSPCGKVPARDLVHIYKNAGYDTVIITDHYFKGYFDTLVGMNWDEKVDAFLKGFELAQAEGNKTGLSVLLGMELRFIENGNDYLVFGIDGNFLREFPELYNMNPGSFKELSDSKGLLIYQAHPFRVNMLRADPWHIDGVEVFNGNPRQISRNELALEFAQENCLRMISGSDFHRPEDVGTGGLVFDFPITNNKDLVSSLREEKIRELIRNI